MNKRDLKILLREAVEEGAVEKELKQLAQDIADGIESKEVKESVGLLTISALFAIPGVIEGVGSLMKLITKIVGSRKGEDISDKIIHTGHKVEKFFTKPIKWAIKKADPSKKDADIDKYANLIHKSIIFLLLVASGIGLASAVQKAEIGHAAAEGVLTAVKGTELAKFLSSKV